jgi:hypothetical protein
LLWLRDQHKLQSKMTSEARSEACRTPADEVGSSLDPVGVPDGFGEPFGV